MKILLNNIIYNLLFGPCKTFRGDTIRFVLNVGTIFFRNKLQRFLSQSYCVSFSIYFFSFFIYIFICQPTIKEIVQYLPLHSLELYCLMTYILILPYSKTLSEDFPEMLRKYAKPIASANTELYENIKRFSKLINIIIGTYVVLLSTSTLLYMPWTGDEDKILFGVMLAKRYFGDLTVLKLLVYTSMFHLGMFGSNMLYIFTYYIVQIKFQLQLLNEGVEKLNVHKNENNLRVIDEKTYQEEIRTQLIKCIRHHQFILRLKGKFNNMVYMSMFFLPISGLILQLSMVIFVYSNLNSSSNYRVILTWVMTNTLQVVLALIGQQLVNESENLHLVLQNCSWHNWDRKNRTLLQLFLINTEKPLVINGSGIVTIDNVFILKMYKMAYTVFTFYEAVAEKM